jgi:hypothetical protein
LKLKVLQVRKVFFVLLVDGFQQILLVSEISLPPLGMRERGERDFRFSKPSPGEVSTGQVRVLKFCPGQIRLLDICSDKLCSNGSDPAQFRTPEVGIR